MNNTLRNTASHIHWFPGHMARTLRIIEEKLPLVDAVLQLLDARVPESSLNPDLQKAFGNKPRLYVLNKADLADPAITKEWRGYFKSTASDCVAVNSRRHGAAQQVQSQLQTSLQELLESRADKGMHGAKIRLMVTGIPNVGKSTFINSWVGSAATKVGARPGVTRGEQWITAGDYELMDMPGVLWKRFDNQQVAVNLALIGSIPDHLLDTEQIASGLLEQIAAVSPAVLEQRYDVCAEGDETLGWRLLERIGKRRGMLQSGGVVDTLRASIMVLDEYRTGKLGRLSLERPPEPATVNDT